MTNHIIDVISYRTAEGVTDAEYIAAARGLDAFLDRCGGMISRSLHKAEDGTWHEIMTWVDQAAYDLSNKQFMDAPEGQAVAALLDGPTLKMQQFETALSRVAQPEAA